MAGERKLSGACDMRPVSITLCGKGVGQQQVMGVYHEVGVTLTLGSYAGCGVTRAFCCPAGGESWARP